ncbi:hypothetical protein, partial [Vibrio parahaemolyticus]|uniref:hypothetical protein n=1 Tax=Vibrio parahaemolyticus TaxID=670 RepID=UPI00215C24F1
TNARNNKAPTYVEALSWNMVPVGGLEPPRPKATDFEYKISKADPCINNHLKSFSHQNPW